MNMVTDYFNTTSEGVDLAIESLDEKFLPNDERIDLGR
jgi:hypothetical protein